MKDLGILLASEHYPQVTDRADALDPWLVTVLRANGVACRNIGV